MLCCLLPHIAMISCVLQDGSKPAFLTAQFGNEPNHLTPVSPDPDEYVVLTRKLLSVTSGDFGRMTVRPLFRPEYSISVDGTLTPKQTSKSGRLGLPDNAYSYVLVATSVVGRSIWMCMPENTTKKYKPVIVKKKRTISYNLAVAIQRVWAKSILQTRYPKNDTTCLDGVAYEFSLYYRGMGTIYGETWSPDAPLPKALVVLGDELYRCASNPKKPLNERDLIKRLKDLEAKIPIQE